MIWDVIQNNLGELALIETGTLVPEGWVVVVQTANPDYLDYMQNLQTDNTQQ